MSKEDSDTRTYHEHFSTPHADIVCISEDGISFRLSSFTLRMTSGFFRSTLALPLPQDHDNTKESEPIFLSEPQSVLERLFSIICGIGITPSELATFEDVTTLLHAAEKYEMPGVIAFVQGTIMHPRFLQEPLRVYGLSCRYGWAEEAKMASELTLGLDLNDAAFLPVVKTLSSTGLMNLIQLRWRRREVLRGNLNGFRGSHEPYTCTCGHQVVPYAWREWRWIILEEFERDPSGKSILSYDFLNSGKADAAFQQKCSLCAHVLFDRTLTVRDLHGAIEKLPSTANLDEGVSFKG